MAKLEGYSAEEKQRIKAIACQMIEGQIVNGTIECTDEAIKAAMPQAVEDARQAVTAVGEYLCG
jgi:hypothetical protein